MDSNKLSSSCTSLLFLGLVPEEAPESGDDCFDELFEDTDGVLDSTLVDKNSPNPLSLFSLLSSPHKLVNLLLIGVLLTVLALLTFSVLTLTLLSLSGVLDDFGVELDSTLNGL